MSKIPTREDILEILKRKGVSKDKFYHAQVVTDIALMIADNMVKDGISIDRKIVEAGALMHDIGLTQTKSSTEAEELDNPVPEHCMIGAQMALEMGFPESVADCIQGHNIITSIEEGKELNLPSPVVGKDYLPHSTEAKIVLLADLLAYAVVQTGLLYDPWEDSEAPAKLSYPFIKRIFKNRTGRDVGLDHPILRGYVEVTREMIKHAPKPIPITSFKQWVNYPATWEGMDDTRKVYLKY